MIAAMVPKILLGNGIKLKNIFAITINNMSPRISSSMPMYSPRF